MPRTRLRKLGSAARLGGKILLAIVLVLVLLVSLALALIDTAPARELVRERANAALSGLFRGKVDIERIGALGLDGVAGVDAAVFDAQGRRVIRASGLTVAMAWPGVVYAALFRPSDPLFVEIRELRTRHVEVRLIDDGSGVPTLARAFEPKKRSTEPSGPPPTVRIGRIDLRHAWVHGALSRTALDAELAHASAELASDASGTAVDLRRAELGARALPLGANPRGHAVLALRVPRRGDLDVRAQFWGRIFGDPVFAAGAYRGERVDAVAYLAGVSPRTVRTLVPGVAPRQGAVLFAAARGRLPELDFDGWLAGGFGRARFGGSAVLDEPIRVQAELEADDVDLRGLVAEAPATRVGLKASARATFAEDGRFEVGYRASTEPSAVEGLELARLELEGRLAGDRAGRVALGGSGRWHEPGLATDFDHAGELAPEARVAVHVRSEVRDPRLLARFAPGARAAGRLRSVVRYEGERLTASVEGSFDALALPDVVAARNVAVRGRIGAGGREPQAELELAAGELELAGRRITDLRASAVGSPPRMHVRLIAEDRRQGHVEAQAIVVAKQGLTLRTLTLGVGEGKQRIVVAARSVRVAGGELRLDDLVLENAGSARASLVWRDGLEELELEAKDLDLARLIGVLAPELELRRAKATLEAHYRRAEGRGALRAEVAEVALAELGAGTLHADLSWQNETIAGDLELAFGRRSRLTLRARELRGILAARGVDDLREATGSLALEGAIRLADTAPALRAGLLPLEDARGVVELSAAVERRPEAPRASIDLDLRTRRLVLRGKRASVPDDPTNEQASAAEPWTVRGVDVVLELTLAGESGEASLSGRLFDRRGDLVRAAAETRIDGDLWQPRALLAALARTPLRANVEMPERELEHWPPQFRPATIAGRVGLESDFSGSLREPNLRARLAALGLRSSEQRAARERKFDLIASLDYTRQAGALRADGRFGNARALALEGRWQGDAAALPAALAADGPSPLRGEARVELTSFPLHVVPWLRHRRLEGLVTGNAELRGFGERPRVRVRARFDRFTAGGVPLDGTRVAAEIGEHSLDADLEAAGKGGTLRGSARSDLVWGPRVAPSLGERLELDLRSRRFRIAALQPMLQGSLSELDGFVDAGLAAKLGQGPAELSGTARWSDGVIQLPAIGQRFHDIDARVRVAKGVVEMPEASARGVAGRLRASGKAWLDGLGLRAAEARLEIAEKEKIPVTVEGASLGDAWGKLGLRYAHVGEDTTRLELDVQKLHVLLPDASPNDVQGLEPAKSIRVGARGKDRRFVNLPLQPIKEESEGGERMLIDVELGRDVWIVQGQTVKVQLRGHVRAELSDPPSFAGRVNLAGGTLDVSGKRFEVERGLIAFQGELERATITATARWDSPLGYRVFADYTGTVADGKIVLHSEPPLSQDQVLSLLLFGAPEGSFGSGPPPDEASTALAVAGGTASKGVNRVLSRFTQLDVSTRVDTSTGAARPELVVQLTPRVAARLTHALGEPAPGQSPDRNFLTLELRLVRRWSLSTVFGDQGASAVDLLWRHRY